ncbi:MAG: hypothetical protein M1837_003744 [Sclerophora amabilis]|nr:MAG: hypothetical protein M1837_003744 [Sclerophora amabilis]
MRSHLTRQVFRRILSNGPYFSPRCTLSSVRGYRGQRPGQTISRSAPRRSLFGVARGSDRELKNPDFDPGLQRMVEFSNLSKIGARPPPAQELVKAFRAFFKAKLQVHTPVQEIQAIQAMRTFKHLKEIGLVNSPSGLYKTDLESAMVALGVPLAYKSQAAHNELARLLFAEAMVGEGSLWERSAKVPKLVPKYVQILCASGDSLEARRVVEEYTDGIPDTFLRKKVWLSILTGLSQEGNDAKLVSTCLAMQDRGITIDAKIHQTMTLHFAVKDDVEQAQKWFNCPIADGESPTYVTNHAMLKLCLRKNEFELGESIFHLVLEGNPAKSSWDSIFQWAAAQGKGVDEIERMMNVMVRRNEDRPKVRPDIKTINRLIELENSRENPYLAERYVALAERWKILPNARTFLLQMEYRIRAGDIEGARAAYHKLQGVEIREDEDLPQINALIRALCARKDPNQDAISELTTDLAERGVRFEASTVSALCLNQLRRKEIHDAHDLLQTHIYHFSLEARADIYSALVEYCLDRSNNSTARAWDAYNILYVVFDEVPVSTRTQLMREFFERGRADMACHVFGHMRQHLRPEHRPRPETYVACFEGIARAADRESLEMVHNMMKLDSTLEPSTRLLNALMLAYTACEMPFRSLEYWHEIVHSTEGPSYESVQIALRACEAAPLGGDRHAAEIWQLLTDMKVDITQEVYVAYIGALAGSARLQEAKDLVDRMEDHINVPPGVMAIGTLYNAIPVQERKDQVEQWAKENYPEVWKELEQRGRKRSALRTWAFKIDRDLKP